MSWFRQVCRAAFLGAVVTLPLLGTGCGFTPIYAKPAGGGASAPDHLATVRILPLPDRVGQQMHNLLRNRLNPKGQSAEPNYNLRVLISETVRKLGIRKDETATRANLIVRAKFELSDAHTNKTLLEGQTRSFNSYNILENQFATLYSESDARDRALRELSDEIRDRLAVYFSAIAPRGS